MRYNVAYRLIVGERSNGKTYSVKERIMDRIKYEPDFKFVYIRRRQEQVTRKIMRRLFEDISDKFEENIGDYIHYSTDAGFYLDDGQFAGRTVGYCMSVEMGVTQKGIPWNDIKLILFDEFLEYGFPIEDEWAKFINLISTIVRKREDVEIFMLANTVTKFSTYFQQFGIDPKKLKQGEIMYGSHQNGMTFAIEYCRSANIIDGIKSKNKYLGFDNDPTSNMIMYGEWDYDVVNTSNIDGIGWSANRRLIPIYLTALGEVYELSIYEQQNPIAFVRKLNTQNGMVRADIKYNLSYDNSLILTTKNGIVPMYGKINSLVDESTKAYYDIFCLCVQAKRIVFDKISSGSDFMKIYKNMK